MPNRDIRGTGVGAKRKPTDFDELRVLVLGGLVMDVFVRTPLLPAWGLAIQADSIELHPGGKGLNQAIAASRLGARVSVIGAVGDDEFGERILSELADYNVDVAGVNVVRGGVTPVTIVFSRQGGDTSFVGWKNASEVGVNVDQVRKNLSAIRSCDVLLSTLEVSPETVAYALRIAHKSGSMTLLNPAPPLERPSYEPSDLPLELVDLLVPNEWEARQLAGRRGESSYSVRDVALFLSGTMGASAVCITRAHNGCSFIRKDAGNYREYEAYETDADDTTGASDAFCSALALHLRAGFETEEAIHQAQAAGAFAVRRQGANRHMPNRRELDAHRRYLESWKGG